MDNQDEFEVAVEKMLVKTGCNCVKLSSINRIVLKSKILIALLEIIPDEMSVSEMMEISNQGFQAIELAWSKWKISKGF